jgi:two-component system, NtrC family, nitrogen regulation sensor histidine kinase NtrY
MPPIVVMAVIAIVASLCIAAFTWARARQQRAAILSSTIALQRFGTKDVEGVVEATGERDADALVSAVNALGASMRRELRDVAQRETLLRTLVDSAPMAIVLFTDGGRIVYTNDAARDLFFEGKALDGGNFLSLLEKAPEPLRKALLGDRDELFTVEEEGERETYHLSKRHFELEGEPHTLLMVKHLTQELNRQEVEVWKKMIRVMNHELNNSLAPISSLIHSARVIAKSKDPAAKLERVFDTVAERADHLKTFLEGYARFARLPTPRIDKVEWSPFLEGIAALHPRVKIEHPTDGDAGWFDAGQMQQVLINLLKNAEEAGGAPEDITLAVEPDGTGGVRLVVRDRGKGMSEEVLRNALLPFYSTKERGTGLGLALCREIVEAHGGRIRIRSREGGGTEVSCRIPGRTMPSGGMKVRLTLTRG